MTTSTRLPLFLSLLLVSSLSLATWALLTVLSPLNLSSLPSPSWVSLVTVTLTTSSLHAPVVVRIQTRASWAYPREEALCSTDRKSAVANYNSLVTPHLKILTFSIRQSRRQQQQQRHLRGHKLRHGLRAVAAVAMSFLEGLEVQTTRRMTRIGHSSSSSNQSRM